MIRYIGVPYIAWVDGGSLHLNDYLPTPGFGMATSSILKTDGSSNCIKRDDFITFQFRNSDDSRYLVDISADVRRSRPSE
jgi:hypothetical protein